MKEAFSDCVDVVFWDGIHQLQYEIVVNRYGTLEPLRWGIAFPR